MGETEVDEGDDDGVGEDGTVEQVAHDWEENGSGALIFWK